MGCKLTRIPTIMLKGGLLRRPWRARDDVARSVGADTHEIVFTSGATESNNIAILGALAGRADKARVVVSAIEHKSVLASARALSRAGHDVVVLPVQQDGSIKIRMLKAALDRPTALVSVGAVNNEIGTVQNIAEIASIAKQSGALMHTDATQALSWNAVDLESWGVDLASFSSHKIGGPKGIGALCVSSSTRPKISSTHFGREQENGIRPGTVPTFLTVAFAAACRTLPDKIPVADWRGTTRQLLDGLRSIRPDLTVNGPTAHGHPGNLSVVLPGLEADRLLLLLQPHVAASRGSACSSGIPELSHVLAALRMSPADMSSTIRFSTGITTTSKDVEEALLLLRDAVVRMELT